MNSEEIKKDEINKEDGEIKKDEEIKLTYTGKDIPLSAEHYKVFLETKEYISKLLKKEIVWKYKVTSNELFNSEALAKAKKIEAKNEEELELELEEEEKEEEEEEKKLDKNGETEAPQEFYDYLKEYATDKNLIRHIIGSDYKIELIKTSILRVCEWRILNNIDKNARPENFKKELNLKNIFSLNHYDKKGHIIAYYVMSALPLTDDPYSIVRSATYTSEKCIKLTEKNGKEQATWIFDMKNLGLSTIPPFKVLEEIAKLFTYYYPERAYQIFIVNTPSLFKIVWKFISNLLTQNTKNKIQVVGWKESSLYSTFQHLIDRDCLLKAYGGNIEDNAWNYEWECQQYQLLFNSNNNNNNNKNDANEDSQNYDYLLG